jgi:hypothetical protein
MKNVLVLIVSVLTLGCTRSDYAVCASEFNFLYAGDDDESSLDLLSKEVKNIDLYIYNKENGDLVRHVQLSPQKGETSIQVPLYAGEYEAVAWGNIGDKTTESQAYQYDTEKRVLNFANDDLHYNDKHTPIFYGKASSIVIDGQKKAIARIPLIKNSKTIDLTIFGNDLNPMCDVVLNNKNHSMENKPSDKLNSIPKIEHYNTKSQKTVFKFKTHRLNEVEQSEKSLRIKSSDLAGGEKHFELIHLIKLGIAKAQALDPEMEQELAEALDKREHFNIEVYLDKQDNNFAITIYVNGYLIIAITPDLR